MPPSRTFWKLPSAIPRPGVLDALVGVQEVVANLRAKADAGLVLVLLSLFGLAFFFFQSRHARAEHFPGGSPVLVLAPFVLTLHDDPGRDVGQSNRAVGLVDVLPAGPTGPKRVRAYVIFIDFDFDVVGNVG